MREYLNSLSGKTAIVTGSSRGIGRAIALTLASYGVNVVVNHVHARYSNSAKEVSDKITKMGSHAYVVRADISKPDQVKMLVNKTIKRFNEIHILVNNAGIFPYKSGRLAHLVSNNELGKIVSVNLMGAFFCSKEVIKMMLRKKTQGKIINIASVAAFGGGGTATGVHYAASKAGLVGLTSSLANQYGKFNITVNAICPGLTCTDFLNKLRKETIQSHITTTPLGRISTPNDIAEAVILLTTHNMIHGQTIIVDGGRVRR